VVVYETRWTFTALALVRTWCRLLWVVVVPKADPVRNALVMKTTERRWYIYECRILIKLH